MTSNISAIGPATIIHDAAAPEVRRSRFSFHINTPRRRRWLLVQLVSVSDDSLQKSEVELNHTLRSRQAQPNLGSLVEDYCTARSLDHSLTRWA